MYKIKEGAYGYIKTIIPRFRVNELAKQVGIKSCFMSLILNGRRNCSKMTAYCICKSVGEDLELADLFDCVSE